MIDVEELIVNLKDSASALGSLRTWVNELQMNVREREAIRFAIMRLQGTLRGNEECDKLDALQELLDRHEQR